MNQLRVLMSAYACEPGKGSEPGVGWNLACAVARHHRVTVLTRANNRSVIEAELRRRPIANLQFAYYDVPRGMSWWKRGPRGVQLYYYLWQIGAARKAAGLHAREPFDLVHHVTFVKYWSPSFMAFLPIPFVWGPVGGGETAPAILAREFQRRERIYEASRSLARWIGEHDPFVRRTARRSDAALAVTEETASRLHALGARNVVPFSNAALSVREVDVLGRLPVPPADPVRFLSMGRLLHWKGFDLGIRAFARAALPGAEYWIVGEGPEEETLRRLSSELGVAERVVFRGRLPREEALAALASCHVLVHPSLHESGGWVCTEAMAAGRPVVCLDLGGPGGQIVPGTGFKIQAGERGRTVEQLAEAMAILAFDPELREEMGASARERARSRFTWEARATRLNDIYREVLAPFPSVVVHELQPSVQ